MNTLLPDFLVHDDCDAVGVVVVDGVAAEDDLSGWVMDCKKTISLDQAGDALIDMVVRTCNGRLTAAEVLGHREFAMTKLYRSA